MENMSALDFGFVGLVTYGFINVLTMWKPNLDNKTKFMSSLVVAFALLWVPADLGILLADKIKIAIGIAVAMSGVSKIATKAGGN